MPSHYDLVVGDAVKNLGGYKGKFNLIVADPPFNIGYDKSSHSQGSVGCELYEDDKTDEEYFEFSRDWISACYDALVPNGTLYIVSGWSKLYEIERAYKNTLFHLLNHVIWQFKFGVYTEKCFTTAHYHVLVLVKNKNDYVFNKQSNYEEDVWFWKEYHRANDEDREAGHPCQLPFVLLKKMILTSSKEEDWVGDVFSGSGSTTLACRRLNRHVIAFEASEKFVPVIKKKARFGRTIVPISKMKNLDDYFEQPDPIEDKDTDQTKSADRRSKKRQNLSDYFNF